MFEEYTNISKYNIMMMLAVSSTMTLFDIFLVKCWLCPSDELLASMDTFSKEFGGKFERTFMILFIAKMAIGACYTGYRFWYDKDKGKTNLAKGIEQLFKELVRTHPNSENVIGDIVAAAEQNKGPANLKAM